MEHQKEKKLVSIREQIKNLPTSTGLYFMKSMSDKVLYIGKAKNLRSRVSSYFKPTSDLIASRSPKIAEMTSKVEIIDFLETENEVDAMLKEARLIKDIRPPYNSDLVDDKTFPYLEITVNEDFPGVYLTRKPQLKSRLFGPFANAKELRGVLRELQKIFKFRSCKLNISEKDEKRRFFRPCLLYSIRQCTAPCSERINKKEYRKIINDFTRFLKSKRSTVIRQLNKQMNKAAEAFEYEKAAMYRDRIRLIKQLDRRGSIQEHIQPEVFASEPTEALEKLQKLLNKAQPIRIIEGIDIAHISGCESVGALVKFIDGRPFKNGYRRFRIKSVKGVDDYAMIAEVVKRRYKYALAGEELWPDFVLIDGGLGQLNAAEKAFKQMKAPVPAVGSLAKKQEELFIRGKDDCLKLPRNSVVLKLLQYVRDEAHRFAQHYHHILRNKKMLNNSL